MFETLHSNIHTILYIKSYLCRHLITIFGNNKLEASGITKSLKSRNAVRCKLYHRIDRLQITEIRDPETTEQIGSLVLRVWQGHRVIKSPSSNQSRTGPVQSDPVIGAAADEIKDQGVKWNILGRLKCSEVRGYFWMVVCLLSSI